MPDERDWTRYYPASNEAKRAARAARRRAGAADTLRFVAAAASYGAARLSDGLTPEQARADVLELAGTLELAAESLRRAVRLRPEQRRQMARLLAGQGVPVRVIAAQIGVCERAARNYVGRP